MIFVYRCNICFPPLCYSDNLSGYWTYVFSLVAQILLLEIMDLEEIGDPFTKLVIDEVNEENSNVNNLTNKDAVETSLTEKDPAKTNLSNQNRVETSLTYKKPVEISLTNKDPAKTNLTSKDSAKTNLTNKDPVNTSLTNRKPVETSLTNKDPEETNLTNKDPKETNLTNNETILTNRDPAESKPTAIPLNASVLDPLARLERRFHEMQTVSRTEASFTKSNQNDQIQHSTMNNTDSSNVSQENGLEMFKITALNENVVSTDNSPVVDLNVQNKKPRQGYIPKFVLF